MLTSNMLEARARLWYRSFLSAPSGHVTIAKPRLSPKGAAERRAGNTTIIHFPPVTEPRSNPVED